MQLEFLLARAIVTHDEFVNLVLRNRVNSGILARLPELGLPDCWLVSGALFQTIWNLLSGYPPEQGIKDYDVFYFDPDTAWQSEDRAIGRANAALADLGAEIEVRNQARVHLWYERKFQAPYPPLACATDGIDRFLQRNAQVGIRPAGRTFEIYAPHGLEDIAELRVRPNRTANFRADLYEEKARRWKALWPKLSIDPA